MDGNERPDVRTCPLCLKPIPEGEKGVKHHWMIPLRFWAKGQMSRGENLWTVHEKCHVEWHQRYDPPIKKWVHYLNQMIRLNYGYGIFAERAA